jgi:hypothetical protein
VNTLTEPVEIAHLGAASAALAAQAEVLRDEARRFRT